MNKIKNIIFDLGGVILNIDYHLTVDEFKKAGLQDFDAMFSKAKQEHLFDDFEKGHISGKQFTQRLKTYLPEADDQTIINAWNAMLLDLPQERLDLLEKLGNEYRLFLLSNTNEIHITAYKKLLQKEHGFPDLSDYFEKQYYSYEIGMRKPDKEIFEFVLEDNRLRPEETFFIDDSIQHVQGALKAGIFTKWLRPEETILDVFH